MATVSNVKPSKALNSILKKFDELIDERAKTLSEQEFDAAEKRADAVFEQVKARASRRGTRERA